ncbi:hypothetical protein ASU66_19500 [Enterobacter hormaechei subsp. xiangfangensis]|uniref:hypothetical protein n=1 Tax=Enterobacter hormaechei TaxID=158836 RepID=UPI0007353DAD|nr:hypothetical protein [Enterobacter hormaechei]KTK25787.1 hypothetical protein ASU66_19500 [Enterobacter hormaechei subsp. xiangfangensis]
MSIYNCLFKPKKSAIKDGAVALAISVEAPNKKIAESIVTGKLWEHYPANGDNFFKPEIWENTADQPHPEIGKFDEHFAKSHTFDGEKWMVNVETTGGMSHLPDNDEKLDFMTISPRERFATVVLFGLAQLDGEIYSQVCDYLDNLENTSQYGDEEDDRLNRYIINAMEAHPPVHYMHQEGLNNLLQAIYVKFENQLPGGAALYSFIKKWTDNPGKREEMLPQNSTSTSTEDNTHAQVAPQRGYKHTYATLDQEIALALLPIEPATTVSVSALRQAERIIEEDREDFKRWSMALRTTEQILKYSHDTIFGVIQNVPAKDTHHFPDSLRRFIDSWLAENGVFEQSPNVSEATSKSLAAGRGEYVDGISDPTDPKWVKTETQTTVQNASNEAEKVEAVTDSQAEAARETLNKMGYSVYASESEQEQSNSEQVNSAEQSAESLVQEEPRPNVNDVEKSITERTGTEMENLDLWKRVFKTDERFTKQFTQNGGGTSINGTYMTMLATREFGPKGIGWGVDILEERFDNGAPITRTVKGQDGNNTWELIPDGIGGYLTEKHHVIKIRLWYVRGGVRGEEISFGCTPYLYGSKYGPLCDGEATKKSLTDATKKALSSLGFSADIFMGLYDNPEYRQKNKEEFALKIASDNAEDAARLRQELDDKLTRVANTLATGVSANEVTKVFASIAREVEVHRKDAEAKGDSQHANYLSKRLRRLTTIKDERLKELNKAQEKTA